jgi:CheY-like chemotaxis protein
MLQGRGHLVRHVPDGSAAVELVGYTLRHADAPRIDLILMDCSMPIVDGYTATALIRYLEAGELESAAAGGAVHCEAAAGSAGRERSRPRRSVSGFASHCRLDQRPRIHENV